MTDQPTGSSPNDVAKGLQPLQFQLMFDDTQVALYEAVVPRLELPGSPVFAVTVTVASAISRLAGAEFEEFLDEMKAAFELLPKLPPNPGGGSGDDDEEPFDPSTQIRIEPRLARFDGVRPAGVSVTMECTTGKSEATGKTELAENGNDLVARPAPHHDLKETVGAGLDQYWHVIGSQPLTATVYVTGGRGTIRYPRARVHKRPAPYYAAGKVVIVHGTGGAMSYNLTGSFSPPHS